MSAGSAAVLKLKNEYDKSDIYKVISDLPNQIRDAAKIGKELNFSFDREKVSNILFAGMGGSAIGGDVVRSLVEHECSVPITVVRNYTLPKWANESTLALISSYSGNTEETLSVYNDARKKGCRIICSATGGKLEELALGDKLPLLKIPKGLPPRGAIAYSAIPWLIIFGSNGIISDKRLEIDDTAKQLDEMVKIYGNLDSEETNIALETAMKLKGKIPIIYVSAGAFSVIGKRWANQLQENAKVLAYSSELPEMNHNEIMGWHLKGQKKVDILPVFIFSELYHERIKKRFEITSRLIEDKGIEPVKITLTGESLITKLFTFINMGDFISYFLALLNEVDPEPVDIISDLKVELAS